MWLRLAEGLLPAFDQPQPSEAATDQPAATPADGLALAGVRAWAEYKADTYADVNAVICPPTRLLLALLEVREVWKARRSADSVRLELLDLEAARLFWDVCRNAVLALPFGDQSRGRAVIHVTVEHIEDREDQPTTPLPGVLPPALSKQFFRCALTAKAIRTGPLANLELPTVEQLAEAIASTISHRINTPPELQHAQWLTETMTADGVEMYHHHTEPTLLRVGDDNLCAISLGQEDEEPDPTDTSNDPSSPDRTPATVPAATAMPGAHADDEEKLGLNYAENDSAMEVDTTEAADLASLTAESHQLRNPQRLSIQMERHPSQPTPTGKGKAATTAKFKKTQPWGRSRSDGATRNRSMSKPRLSGTRGSDSEWETDDDAAHPSISSHQ
eukprot:jgi/Tetstr1/455980/TSEL_042759.t1